MKRGCRISVWTVLTGIVMGSVVAWPACATAQTGPLQVLKTLKVGGPGGWDYLTVDSATQRVYVSHATHVMVLNLSTGTLIGEIPDTSGVHGIALVPERNEGFTSNGRENTLTVFDLKTLKALRMVPAGRNPDAIIYDPFTKKVFAFNGRSGDITIVDTTAPDTAPVTLPVGGKLESGVSDEAGHIYVNVEDKSEIVAVDSRENKVLAHWPIAPGEEPTGLAIDREHHRLFAGCGNQMMVVVDLEQGKVLTTAPVGSGVDGIAFDAASGLIVTPNGRDGTLTVVKEDPAGTFKVVQTLKTAVGARTITSDPKTHRFYLPCNVTTNGVSEFSVLVVGVPG